MGSGVTMKYDDISHYSKYNEHIESIEHITIYRYRDIIVKNKRYNVITSTVQIWINYQKVQTNEL